MAFTASLSRFHGLVSQAISDLAGLADRPTHSDTGESFIPNQYAIDDFKPATEPVRPKVGCGSVWTVAGAHHGLV